MSWLSFEHGRMTYWSDFVAYGAAVAGLANAVGMFAPRHQLGWLLAIAVAGVAAWTLIEYALHRFVLHGLDPFRRWHAAHHQRPSALLSTPTLVSASLIFALVCVPTLLIVGPWPAAALTLGVTTGYFAYSLVHHATHHWRPRGRWMARRKLLHARHHYGGAGFYGVSTSIWDRAFGTASANAVTSVPKAQARAADQVGRTGSTRLAAAESRTRAARR